MATGEQCPKGTLDEIAERYKEAPRLANFCRYLMHPCNVNSGSTDLSSSEEIYNADLNFSVYAYDFQDTDVPAVSLIGPFIEISHSYSNKSKLHVFRKADGSKLWASAGEKQIPSVTFPDKGKPYISLKCKNFREIRLSPLET